MRLLSIIMMFFVLPLNLDAQIIFRTQLKYQTDIIVFEDDSLEMAKFDDLVSLCTSTEVLTKLSQIQKMSVASLKSKLTAKRLDRSSLIELTCDANSEEQGEETIYHWVNILSDICMERKLEPIQKTLAFIDNQISFNLDMIKQGETELRRFMDEYGVVDMDKETDLLLAKRTKIEEKLGQLESELFQLEELKSEIVADKRQQIISKTELPIIRQKLENLNYKMKTAASDETIHSLKKDLLEHVDFNRKDLQREIGQLQQEFLQSHDILKKMAPLKEEFRTMSQNIAVLEKIYSQLLEKRAKLMIRKAGILPTFKVVGPPEKVN